MPQVYPVLGRKNRVITKISAKTAALLFAVISMMLIMDGYFHYQTSSEIIKQNTEKQLLALASNFAAALNPKEIELLQSQADEKSLLYEKLQQKLQKIQKRNSRFIKYIYVIGQKGTSYYYLLDAVPNGRWDHSALGQPFDIKSFPEAAEGFSRPSAEKKPTYDSEYGLYSQSGYAPIKDDKGKTVGVLGFDMGLPAIQTEHRKLFQEFVLEVGMAFILALVFGVGFSCYMTKPICTLTEGLEKMAAGDFDCQIKVERRDELGTMAASFNKMAGDLQALHNQLQGYNQQLELEVRRQTAELTAVNREMQDIMDNICLGIFTIDRQFKIQPQYSKYLESIFPKSANGSLANYDLLDLFFPGPGSGEARESLNIWLQLVFGPGQLQWLELLQLQPLHEVNLETQAGGWCLRVAFLPVKDQEGSAADSGHTEKIMVLVEDITKTRSLEKELEERDQAFKENAEQMAGFVKNDPELIRQFLIESNDELEEMEIDLMRLVNKGNLEVMPRLLRFAHTIKGNAGNCGLRNISNTTHALEELFERLHGQAPEKHHEWAGQVFKRIDKLKDQLAQVETVYWQIIDQKVKDNGQTRSANRVRESSALLKVNTADFKNLEEMVLRIREKVSVKPEDEELKNLFELTEGQFRKLQMVRVGRIFTRFRRMVHDISEELEKKVNLKMSGEEIWVEKNVFDWVADPMIHLLRNSLDHGIESPRDRLLAGKPEEGTIRLEVFLIENALVVEVADDGRGLEVEQIRERAVLTGLRSREEITGMSEAEQLALIFEPGFSTNETVTQISGRGIGMDIVKSVVEGQLQGRVLLENREGFGLCVRMEIPMRRA